MSQGEKNTKASTLEVIKTLLNMIDVNEVVKAIVSFSQAVMVESMEKLLARNVTFKAYIGTGRRITIPNEYLKSGDLKEDDIVVVLLIPLENYEEKPRTPIRSDSNIISQLQDALRDSLITFFKRNAIFKTKVQKGGRIVVPEEEVVALGLKVPDQNNKESSLVQVIMFKVDNAKNSQQ
ncbi:hypothetical protein GFS03_04210 [Sulfolobus sp. E5-1-F]|uniref:hypothetical protein n=1 Tax=Sulfolobaceae TaxID=118883 RepID=UPI001294996A|nr:MULTISPECIES: hypothetical protein [unclassified Sulfolobus]QGA53840.1 hypothetical protein GFS03_04210 [Sulfolobus sp. E5-1-F]QGA69055.1 hypothetical protein GFS33_10360 [Sulfolobus sp. E11-6]